MSSATGRKIISCSGDPFFVSILALATVLGSPALRLSGSPVLRLSIGSYDLLMLTVQKCRNYSPCVVCRAKDVFDDAKRYEADE